MYPLETKLDAQFLLFYLLSDFFTKKAVEKSIETEPAVTPVNEEISEVELDLGDDNLLSNIDLTAFENK